MPYAAQRPAVELKKSMHQQGLLLGLAVSHTLQLIKLSIALLQVSISARKIMPYGLISGHDHATGIDAQSISVCEKKSRLN